MSWCSAPAGRRPGSWTFADTAAVAVSRRKRGFTLPFEAWMRGPLRVFCERQLGAQGLDGRGVLKPGEAPRLWAEFLRGVPGRTASRIWALVALNAWLDRQGVA
jgi:asparagine synthase (glutamine-hydrolysing)